MKDENFLFININIFYIFNYQFQFEFFDNKFLDNELKFVSNIFIFNFLVYFCPKTLQKKILSFKQHTFKFLTIFLVK